MDKFIVVTPQAGGTPIFGDLPVCMDAFEDMPTGLYWVHDDANAPCFNCPMIHVNNQTSALNGYIQIYFDTNQIYMYKSGELYYITLNKAW